MHNYWVYILTNSSCTVLYVGMTNNLIRRIGQHKEGLIDGFTKRYRLNKLVYYEHTSEVESAIFREKQLKKWRRNKKVELVEQFNPNWYDLYKEIVE